MEKKEIFCGKIKINQNNPAFVNQNTIIPAINNKNNIAVAM